MRGFKMKTVRIAVELEHSFDVNTEAEANIEAENIELPSGYVQDSFKIVDTSITNEIKVLREFVKEFSPIHGGLTDQFTYNELFTIISEIVEAHNDD